MKDVGISEKKRITRDEISFWDRSAANYRRPLGIPTVESMSDPFTYTSDRFFIDTIGDVQGKKVLDIGCGLGTLSLFLARLGACVAGIDLSKQMVTRCQARSDLVKIMAHFIRGDAELLPFKDGSFDLVVGSRTLHHLPNLSGFLIELDRVLADGGKAVFVEPQRCNPVVEVNRKLLRPSLRTKDEHPLAPGDLQLILRAFPDLRVRAFYLVSPAAFLVKYLSSDARLFEMSYRLLQELESIVTEKRIVRKFCWQVVLTMQKGSRG